MPRLSRGHFLFPIASLKLQGQIIGPAARIPVTPPMFWVLCFLRAQKLSCSSLTRQHVPHIWKQLLESEMAGPKRLGGVMDLNAGAPRKAHNSFCGLYYNVSAGLYYS